MPPTMPRRAPPTDRPNPAPARGRRSRPRRKAPAAVDIALAPCARPARDELLLRRGHVSADAIATALIAQRAAPQDARASPLMLYATGAIKRAAAPRALAVAPVTAANAATGIDVAPPTLAATMVLEYQQMAIDITGADVSRGYVDVPGGSRFAVATSGRAGYAVDLVTKVAIFTAVRVHSATASADLGADGGTLVAGRVAGVHAREELSYRFMLAPSVKPGRYPFPLFLAVRPLDGPG